MVDRLSHSLINGELEDATSTDPQASSFPSLRESEREGKKVGETEKGENGGTLQLSKCDSQRGCTRRCAATHGDGCRWQLMISSCHGSFSSRKVPGVQTTPRLLTPADPPRQSNFISCCQLPWMITQTYSIHGRTKQSGEWVSVCVCV